MFTLLTLLDYLRVFQGMTFEIPIDALSSFQKLPVFRGIMSMAMSSTTLLLASPHNTLLLLYLNVDQLRQENVILTHAFATRNITQFNFRFLHLFQVLNPRHIQYETAVLNQTIFISETFQLVVGFSALWCLRREPLLGLFELIFGYFSTVPVSVGLIWTSILTVLRACLSIYSASSRIVAQAEYIVSIVKIVLYLLHAG